MLYSKSAEYAIQALIYLSENQTDKPTMIASIAEAYNIPYQFLAKIVQTLVKRNLVVAKRGRNGGINLSRKPKYIYLTEIIDAIDSNDNIKAEQEFNNIMSTKVGNSLELKRQEVAKTFVQQYKDQIADEK